MARLSPERRQAIITAVQQGRTVPEIHAELGEAKRTIAYVAAQAGMTIQSRYCRVIRGSYWQQMRGRYWRAVRLNAQLRPVAIGRQEDAECEAGA